MAQSRDDRRQLRRRQVAALFPGAHVDAALDLLELVELAWHDCFGEVAPPDIVVDDVLVVSRGDLGALARAARLAVTDWRDVRVAADAVRAGLVAP